MPKIHAENTYTPEALRELGARIDECCGTFPTRKAAAAAMGISPQHLRRLIKGTGGAPGSKVLAQLADASGHSLAWLQSGAGAKRAEGRLARLTAIAARNSQAAQVLGSSLLRAQLATALLHAAEEEVARILPGGSAGLRDEVLGLLMETVAPQGLAPDDWQERLDGALQLLKFRI